MTAARILSLWGPVAAFVVAQWWLSSRVLPEGGVVVWDKALHAGAWAVLGALLLRACHGGLERPARRWPTVAAVCLALGYAAVDEWHQSYVPGRVASLGDWLADATGVGGAWLALRAGGWLPPAGRTG